MDTAGLFVADKDSFMLRINTREKVETQVSVTDNAEKPFVWRSKTKSALYAPYVQNANVSSCSATVSHFKQQPALSAYKIPLSHLLFCFFNTILYNYNYYLVTLYFFVSMPLWPACWIISVISFQISVRAGQSN